MPKDHRMSESGTPSEIQDFERLTFLRSIDVGSAVDKDPSTWTVGGRPLTPRELEIAVSITPQELEEAAVLAQTSHQARSRMAQATHQSLLSILDPYGYPEVSQLEAIERAPQEIQLRALRIIYRAEGPSEAEQMWRTLQARALARRMVDKMLPEDVLSELAQTTALAVEAGDLTEDEANRVVAEARGDAIVARQRLVEAVTEGAIPGVPISRSFHQSMRREEE
jgi:hypothetical protein